ncbi:sialate O-acetylesterase [Desulfosarcina sp.]|uniref:sialate O-acetylesterase n=1 Tax=Desulfosarcina sp. TaxID=2027861 RepID=UPI0039707032
MKKILALIFVVLLSAPVSLWLAAQLGVNGDNTVGQGFPAPETTLWSDRGYYQAVEGWFRESLPAARPLKRFHNWVDYHLFSATTAAQVYIGSHGWLYPADSAADDPGIKVARQKGQRLFLELHAVEKMVAALGRRFLVTVVPGKASIYPEYAGGKTAGVQHAVYQALHDAHGSHPLNGFIGLEAVLKKAKLSGVDVYHKHARLWSCGGAAAAAEQILARSNLAKPPSGYASTAACPPPDSALYDLLIGGDRREKKPLVGHAAGPHAVNGPVAVVYGDDFLIHLLPLIARAFNRVTVIDSTQVPTFGRDALSQDSDVVLLQCSENSLEGLHLNLESIFAASDPRMQGVVKQKVALAAAAPLTHCALDIGPDGLQIRSSGEAAFFSLPPLPGSTTGVFRMLKLTFSSTHQGRITVKTRPDVYGLIERTLSRENRQLIVPLPFDESVEVQINPSQHAGVFTLEDADLLSFYGKNPPPAPAVAQAFATVGDISGPMAIEPPAGGPDGGASTLPGPHPTDALPELDLTDIQEGRIFQRQGATATVAVTGAYTGAAGAVEARVVDAKTGRVIVAWTVVDPSPQNGVYTGILPHVPQGGWYRLHVRSGITPWVVEEGVNRWGVGMLVACIGQSNMREWFATGKDHQPASLLMFHSDGRWQKPMRSGNGALALGNRLAEALNIPVGLLDYSVNGTGLTAKAEWGQGFWLDTGPHGIYRRLIEAVDSTGGSVEYVLWMQGEADAARGTVTQAEYRAGLERLVNEQLRSDIKNGSTRSQLPFLIIPLVKRPTGKDTTCQWIREAQMDALKTIDACHLAALSIDLENRGRQHLAPVSYSILGIRTAQTILYLLGEMPYHRGPTITAVTRTADRVIDISITHRGGTDFTPGSTITGFEALWDGQPVAVTSVSRLNAKAIRIHLQDKIPGEVRVRYLYGAHPDTSNPVRDNTALQLPLEPYSPD